MDNRLSFAPGEQNKFLLEARAKLGKSWSEIAKLIDVHPRSLRDWVREKYHISQSAAQELSKICDIEIPKSAQSIIWRDHLRKAGEDGCVQQRKKYGISDIHELVNEEYRQNQWRKWWEATGRYQKHPIINQPKSVIKPKLSPKLAELVGIVLGDGAISRNQIVITHHRFDDKLHADFIRQLIRELFHIEPGTHTKKDSLADNIFISRVELVKYFVDVLGLRIGNKVKQQVDIPDWIKSKKSYIKACVRGLVDTDGCVFNHTYRVNGKTYSYKKLDFTSHSKPLKQSVYRYLCSIGLRPRITKGNGVRLESIRDVRAYFQKIGSHNPKHLNRYLR